MLEHTVIKNIDRKEEIVKSKVPCAQLQLFEYLRYVNIGGVPAGGQAGGLLGVGALGSGGVLHHELGHAFGLPHAADNPDHPYKGPMHGIAAPKNFAHVGNFKMFDFTRWGR